LLGCAVTFMIMQDSERLRSALWRDFPNVVPSSDRAWSRPPAVRVVDCVLSLRRNYDRFLVPRLNKFEERFPQVTAISHLRELIDTYESPAAFVKDALNYNDAQRAQTLNAVIDYLLQAMHRTDEGPELEQLRRWADGVQPRDYRKLGIRGFGLAGFQYLRMLFGANTTKPDVHICRYVENAVGHRVADIEALSLLEEAVRGSSISLRDLDTSIWESSAREFPKEAQPNKHLKLSSATK